MRNCKYWSKGQILYNNYSKLKANNNNNNNIYPGHCSTNTIAAHYYHTLVSSYLFYIITSPPLEHTFIVHMVLSAYLDYKICMWLKCFYSILFSFVRFGLVASNVVFIIISKQLQRTLGPINALFTS